MNSMNSDSLFLAVGDIHGCHRELLNLFEAASKKYDLENPNIRFVFLGDYIDRGDSSVAVLDVLAQFQKEFPQSIFLKGNHEWLLQVQGPSDQCDLPAQLNQNWIDLLNSAKIWHEEKHYLFLHGGPETPDADLSIEEEEYLVWNYHPSNLGWRGKWLVKGHTVVPEVRLQNKTLYVDTGCCFGNHLSCAVLSAEIQELVETIKVERIRDGTG
jgi:serine/threonine protein phosphatase 1